MRNLVQFDISHTLRYRYSRAVFLEPHELRLQPRDAAHQRLRSFALSIEPEPAGRSQMLDAEGNSLVNIWFDGLHDELLLSVRSRVETRRTNPFDYLLQTERHGLPLRYDAATEAVLPLESRRRTCFGEGEGSPGTDEVAAFTERLARDHDRQLVPFLNALNQTIYDDFEFLRREEGPPWSADRTLAGKRGACRDLAVLFIEACRSQGAAARFVSGYQEGDPDQDHRDLHAWVEVLIPGAGWRGFDPTHGLAVGDGHVEVAASVLPALATPVIGSIRGTGATAELETHITIDVGDLAWEEIQQVPQQQQQQEPGRGPADGRG